MDVVIAVVVLAAIVCGVKSLTGFDAMPGIVIYLLASKWMGK